MITQERVRELFKYDELTGRLHRINCEKQGHKIVTDGISTQGYFVRWVDDVCYLEHVLVYLWHTGTFASEIDHHNGVKTDNRIGNLRMCCRTLNNANQGVRRNNTSGFRGVSRKGTKWLAQGTSYGVHYHLGLHTSPESASLAYEAWAIEHFGDFAYVRRGSIC